jgi:thioredoxin reductase (NADPH)
LVGAGVIYGAAVAEAHAFAGQRVFVVGGGNSAGQAAMHLARYADRVTILIRSNSLASSMSSYLIHEIGAARNIDVRRLVEVVGGGGDGRLEWLELKDHRTGDLERVPAAGLRSHRRTAKHLLAWQCRRPGQVGLHSDRRGPRSRGRGTARRAAAALSFETSLPGVFAVGDVRHGSVKRVASAVGEGSVAVRSVHDYLALPPTSAVSTAPSAT